MADQAPTIGRIVRYFDKRVTLAQEEFAGIITSVGTEFITLTVFVPFGAPITCAKVSHDPDHADGTWDWPERA